MDEELKVDVNLINTCHGCLSTDRTLCPLGINSDMLISLLGCHRHCLVYGVEDIKICWECISTLKKFKMFQNQVRKAQAGLMKKLYEIDSHVTTLSKLAKVNKYYYDLDVKHYTFTKLKKNNEQVTVIKTEFEDNHTYSDDDDHAYEDDNKTYALDNNADALDNNPDTRDNNAHEPDNKNNALDNKITLTKDDIGNISADDFKEIIVTKSVSEIEIPIDLKDEPVKDENLVKVKVPRRQKDTKCVNNVVGYYKKYATLVRTEKKDWGSWEDVRGHFKLVQFTEKEIEDNFCTKDRYNISYTRMPHKCNICTLGYTKAYDLKRHNDLNHHKEGTPFKCTLCSKKQASHDALEKHWRTHSIVFKCKTCSDVCKENFMRKHLDHAHTKVYDCSVCHAKFSTLKRFTIHYKTLHMKYVCDYCGHTLTTKKKIEKHISEHHMTYTCKDCNRSYKNYLYYKKHCYSLHPDKMSSKSNPAELSFCVECNKQFPSVDKYKTHLRVSTKHNKKKNNPLPCPECGKLFGRKKNMTYHYNLFHLKKTKYYCEICDKYFSRPSGLATHRENVHLKIEKVKDKICDLCGRAFHSHVVLRHHRRTHTGERPHKCPHCSAEFIQKYAMQTHVRTQHKELAKDAYKEREHKRTGVPVWPDTGYFV